MPAPTMPFTWDACNTLLHSQLGVTENPPYSNVTPYTKWYGITGAWCDMFQSWIDYTLGYRPQGASTSKGWAYTPAHAQWFMDHGAWAGPERTPAPGWLAFHDFPGDGVNRISHVERVIRALPDGRNEQIGGNTTSGGGRDGGSVVLHNRSRNTIVGYGIVNYQPVAKPTPAKPKPAITFPIRPLLHLTEPNMVGDDVQLLKFTLAQIGYRFTDWRRFGPGTASAIADAKRRWNALAMLSGHPERKVRINDRVAKKAPAEFDTWDVLVGLRDLAKVR